MENQLHWADYIIMAGLLGISLAIGVYHSLTGGRQKTTSEFILANRKLMVIPTILSMVMSYMSAIAIIGATAEIYDYGAMVMVWYFPGDFIGNVFIALVIVPWIYPLKLVSIFDYLQYRYNSKAVRYVGASIGIFHAILYNGVAMFAPSIALESVTGLSVMVSLPVLAVVGTGYTALGGMRAVIWTDVFQGLVLIAGISAVQIKGLILTGGFGEVVHEAKEHGRMILDEVNPDPRIRNSALSLICGSFLMVIFMKGFCQASVQRYSSTQTSGAARRTILGNGVLTHVLFFLAGFNGLTVFAYYAKERCDPILSGLVNNPNKILTVFVQEVFKKNIGFSGFFIATLYSGSLSSLSSNLSGCAANIWEDLLKPFLGHRLSDYRVTQLNRVLVVITGVLSLGVAYVCNTMPGTMIQLTGIFFGACGGPMVGLFLLGGLFRFTNYIGALAGVIVSFTIVGCISVGSMTVPQYTPALPPGSIDGCLHFNDSELMNLNASIYTSSHYTSGASAATTILDSIYQLSFQFYGILGVALTLLTGTVVSAITNKLSNRIRKSNSAIPDKYFIKWRNAFRTPPPIEDDDDSSQMKDWEEIKGLDKENNCKADVTRNLLVSDERL